jgi:hypothetical protein
MTATTTRPTMTAPSASLPVWRNLRHRLVVSHAAAEGPSPTSVYLTGRNLDRLPVRAGQFFQWRCLDGLGWTRSHPYSLSATPRPGPAGHRQGSGRRQCPGGITHARHQSADRRPYGKLTGETYNGGPVVILACGIGVTPLLSLFGELPYRPGEATLIYRARNEREIAFRAELDWFAAGRGVSVIHLLGPRATGPSWLPASTPTTPTPPSCGRSHRTSPARTSTSAAPAHGPGRAARPFSRPTLPPAACTPNCSPVRSRACWPR